MRHFIDELKQSIDCEVRLNEPLAEYTTWKIGGPADALIAPASKEELINVMRLIHKHKMPWIALGRGSNLLVSDKGIRGAVLRLGDGMNDVRFDQDLVEAGASYSFIKLSVMAGKQGLTGLEFAGGIPGSVGGAVYMNAGALGSDVSRVFKSAEIVLETGELVQYGPEDMKFAYRHSVLHELNGIVVSATFQLAKGEKAEITAAMAANKERRLRTQPLQMACAGSVFRNPPGDYAARLVEASGLKGLRSGGAEVSTMHANFIVNTGQATAEDVLSLMANIQRKVKEDSGIDLVPEVLAVGER
ncbi:UDP-N-acetylmuramate dehydrogenase [Paenibacillus sp. GCM10012307]|uniref:UDP-N-acetylenolpyruvoylglucosamine reductase n=1 Tax=Paenibacillus roseus TaxID=2798579 RepID=A0A934MSD5_9BACL|nr:UDP-N-acetylmuramate dehydrogenase [Paenibacillus roseus]MBJ6363159.1 UDP-N-acetylmuramate dehydrogenase [Paenibacillus roseus]